MLLISCPWCGPRDEIEFHYGGEAHIADPRTPPRSPTRQWARLPLHARQPEGRCSRERWVHAHGCRRWFNVLRDTVTHQILAVYRIGETPPDRTNAATDDAAIPPADGRPHRPRAAAPLHLRRPRISRAIAGDTLASALLANGVHLVGAQLQVSPAARHHGGGRRGAIALVQLETGARYRAQSAARPRSSSTTGCVASSVNRWPSLGFDLGAVNGLSRADLRRPASITRPSCGRDRFGIGVHEPLLRRMAGLGHAPTEPDPDAYDKRTRTATCWWSAADPPVFRPRWPRPAPART